METINDKNFLKMDDREKHFLITTATKLGLTEQLTKECLVAMLIYQSQQIDDLYDAFQVEQAGKSGYFD